MRCPMASWRRRVFNQARSRVDETDLFSRPSENSGVPKGMVINRGRRFRLIRSRPRPSHCQPIQPLKAMRVRADCRGSTHPQECVHRDRRRPWVTTVQPSRRQKQTDFQAPAPTVFTPLVGCALRQALCERPGRSALHLHRVRCPKEPPSPDPLEHGPRRHEPDASTFLQPKT